MPARFYPPKRCRFNPDKQLQGLLPEPARTFRDRYKARKTSKAKDPAKSHRSEPPERPFADRAKAGRKAGEPPGRKLQPRHGDS